ncbi:Alpha/beta hydrolase family protein [Micromonospora citrea]|uniref:Alpha/beta hydrolase family protein n=1 Tax=Micromonospora citrea TaxID=47855 RepID=A0A1C6TQT3_9ACTN|nr:lipase [Micromonospora citrea]SCL43991.1 Alpha/beta hydrolase family protein [Micromonospora citrea]
MRTISRRRLLGGAAAAVSVAMVATAPAALAHAAPGAESVPPPATNAPLRLRLPVPTGPYAVAATELHLVDHDRPDPWVAAKRRELMVTVWYPARPAARGPLAPYLPPLAAQLYGENLAGMLGIPAGQVDWAGFATHARTGAPARVGHRGHPVVLYSPGGDRNRAEGTVLVEELVSRGYVVVTMDHTYEAPVVEFPGGRLATQRLSDLEPVALSRLLIHTRVQDTRFVLDQLAVLARGGNPDAGGRRLPDGLGAALDLSRAGMFGHSAGGFTTAEAMLADRRLDAGADLDGSMAYSTTELGEVAVRGLDRPFLLMGTGLVGGRPYTHLDAPDWRAFWANSPGWKRDLYVPDGQHFTFTDHQLLLPQLDAAFPLPEGLVASLIGTVDPGRIIASQRAYLSAFFDQHLRRRPRALLDSPSPRHPDVTFVR